VRDVVHRLGSTENEAVIANARRSQSWEKIVENWPAYSTSIRPGLPEEIRESAGLSRHFFGSKPNGPLRQWMPRPIR
jgi:hypothetical protein